MNFQKKHTEESLSTTDRQLKVLDDITQMSPGIPYFKDKLAESGIPFFKPAAIDVLQINVGKKCNQVCKHCHVNSGPQRTELMDKPTLEICLDILNDHAIPVVDITGGAPEMNPHFKWFVEACRALEKRVIVRCNLTILLYQNQYRDLPGFYAKNQVELVCSLPYYNASRTDRVRGKGVFDQSIEAMRLLNAEGYGKTESGLEVNLVYNPAGAFLPAPQHLLEEEFKKELFSEYGIVFNNLFSITNMPVSRFLDYLLKTDNYVSYVENLVNAFNPAAAMAAMCLNMISVSWDGYIYDCDFNQMLDMKIDDERKNHVSKFDAEYLLQREVQVSQHCYGCTAGGGSGCGGATV